MRSNRLNRTLDRLRHRVTAPEVGIAESVDGAVITALNEEAVVCAAFGNKGGINLVASYEAFAVKMLGAVRQELIFARHQKDAGIEVSWLGVPILLTSHTWENGKNEQSHQDPTLAEALLAEMSDVSRVVFPPDWNTALATLRAVYNSRGQIWSAVVPKRPLPCVFSSDQAEQIVKNGAVRLKGTGGADEALIMTATGAYQLREVITASERLTTKGVSHSVIYLYEPGRFRVGRDAREQTVLTDDNVSNGLYPAHGRARVFVTHTRPESFLGVVRPLDTGPPTTVALGYRNRGGTLDVKGMLFANSCTWAHIVAAAAKTVALPLSALLTDDEISAINGQRAPAGVLFEAPR
jgi:phosphoketolase